MLMKRKRINAKTILLSTLVNPQAFDQSMIFFMDAHDYIVAENVCSVKY